ncbi:MAG TPA: mannose-1-phosphate guanylyltransferase [Chlamydiales bacterium]|nr:mannose-1-phosphate guanylyltransferase [Chlamydiales bacterium]
MLFRKNSIVRSITWTSRSFFGFSVLKSIRACWSTSWFNANLGKNVAIISTLLLFSPIILASASIDLHAILLAGGGGTRLWPASRDAFPKQFIDFGTGASLLEQTVERLLKFEHLAEIVIATSEPYESLVRSQIEKYEGQTRFTLLIEPCRRNTGPAIAYAVKYLSETIPPDDPILVVPADHFIEPDSAWIASIESALPAVADGQIATFGIKPTKPETGFGYLEFGAPFDQATQSVLQFIEKPTREKAEKLIQSDQIFWNSGIFLFSARTFWEELSRHSPEIYRLSTTFEEMGQNFSAMPNLSIDYALMEKTKRIVAAPLQIHWSDIGSWDGLYEILPHDEQGNVLQGNVLPIETQNSLIFSKKLIATIGIEDLLIIETDDAILICKKEHSQKIKELLKKLN